jgi:hypothetical protein
LPKRTAFWDFDIVAGYRFPKRNAKMKLIMKSILNEKFDYHGAGDHVDQRATPETLSDCPPYYPMKWLFD